MTGDNRGRDLRDFFEWNHSKPLRHGGSRVFRRRRARHRRRAPRAIYVRLRPGGQPGVTAESRNYCVRALTPDRRHHHVGGRRSARIFRRRWSGGPGPAQRALQPDRGRQAATSTSWTASRRGAEDDGATGIISTVAGAASRATAATVGPEPWPSYGSLTTAAWTAGAHCSSPTSRTNESAAWTWTPASLPLSPQRRKGPGGRRLRHPSVDPGRPGRLHGRQRQHLHRRARGQWCPEGGCWGDYVNPGRHRRTRLPGDDGPAIAATWGAPKAIRCDAAGDVIVVDTENHAIRRIDAGGIVTTIAGGHLGGDGDGGPATAAGLERPHGCGIGPDGTLYIADSNNHRVRAVGL